MQLASLLAATSAPIVAAAVKRDNIHHMPPPEDPHEYAREYCLRQAETARSIADDPAQSQQIRQEAQRLAEGLDSVIARSDATDLYEGVVPSAERAVQSGDFEELKAALEGL